MVWYAPSTSFFITVPWHSGYFFRVLGYRPHMLDKKAKDRIIAKYRTHEKDTGSPQVQIAIISAEILELVEHLQQHKKDFSSRRGLVKKVNERRSLLRYLERENIDAFLALCKQLKIKIARRVTDSLEVPETELVAEIAGEEPEKIV